MARVTRGGGGFALLWNEWSDDDPTLGPIDALLAPIRPPLPRLAEADRLAGFGAPTRRRFVQRRRLSGDQLVAWAASTSGFINAPPAEQQRIAQQIRDIAGAVADVAIATDVVVAERVVS
jgi:hypothetical protein